MSIWRAAANLRTDALTELEDGPWEYDDTRPAGLDSKAKFRKWQNDESTDHIHFTLIEPFDPGRRVSEDNPARRMFGWVADYDSPTSSDEFIRRTEAIDPTLRPAWFSRTFSGGIRAVWLFEEPVWADCSAVAGKFMRHFAVRVKASTLAPNLDQASFALHMLWEQGTAWTAVPESSTVPASVTNSIFFDAVNHVKKVEGTYTLLPMDEVQAEIERKYPGRLYGAKIEIGERVPLFWLPVSGDHKEKDKSAIVAEWGIYSFSSRSEQGRMFWDELLGYEFIQKYKEKRLDSAINGCYFDGTGYWRLDYKGDWQWFNQDNTNLWLRVERGLSGSKKPKETASEVEQALYAIQSMHRIEATAPFTFTDEQFVEWNGETYLNTNRRRPMCPAGEGYGNPENFPWLREFFHNFFDSHPSEKVHPREYYLAELQRAYRGFYESVPTQGHVVILAGGPGKGKSLLTTFILRRIFGSAADAGGFLVAGKGFNKSLGESAIWFVDDNQSAGSFSSHKAFSEVLKKHVATPEVVWEPKFKDARSIPWYGRIYVSCNDDADSISIVPDLDINILDKISIFKVNPDWTARFLPNKEMEEVIVNELPYFLRWLLDEFEPAEGVLTPDKPRYGIRPYWHIDIVKTARESSAQYRLAEVLELWRNQKAFEDKSKLVWIGNSTALLAELQNPDNGVRDLVKAETAIGFGRKMNALVNQGVPWLKRVEDGGNKASWQITLIEKVG